MIVELIVLLLKINYARLAYKILILIKILLAQEKLPLGNSKLESNAWLSGFSPLSAKRVG